MGLMLGGNSVVEYIKTIKSTIMENSSKVNFALGFA